MPHDKKDYIPARDADFDGWLSNLTNYVSVKAASWTHIQAEKVAELKKLEAEWQIAFNKTLGPHTSVETEGKNEKRAAAEGFIRPFVAQFLKFDPVTNEDRVAMGLHNRAETHTPIGKPSTRALITDLKALGGFQVEIRFQDEGTPDSQARPYGMNGCLLNYFVRQERVTDYALLTQSKLMTHNPFTLELPPDTSGKFLSCAIRWQSERGEIGPWSDIMHIVIG